MKEINNHSLLVLNGTKPASRKNASYPGSCSSHPYVYRSVRVTLFTFFLHKAFYLYYIEIILRKHMRQHWECQSPQARTDLSKYHSSLFCHKANMGIHRPHLLHNYKKRGQHGAKTLGETWDDKVLTL